MCLRGADAHATLTCCQLLVTSWLLWVPAAVLVAAFCTEGAYGCLMPDAPIIQCTWGSRQSRRTLLQLLHFDPTTRAYGQPGYGAGSGKPDVMFGFLKHMWSTGDRHDAFQR